MITPDTKLTGDIAEQATILQALKKGWNILKPIGDRLPYDMVFEINGKFCKIQVKAAWFENRSGNYIVDTRRSKTNRKESIKSKYQNFDFDFAIAYLIELDIFYIFPIKTFLSYGSEIALVEHQKRQRKPKSADFRNAWELIEQWAASEEIPT